MANELCTQISNSGFLHGLWDGITAPFSLVASLFFNVQFYDTCSRSWWYNCMFMIGMIIPIILGGISLSLMWFVFVASLVLFIIWSVFANILYIIATIAIICLVAYLVNEFNFKKPKQKARSYKQSDGSEVFPPGR